MVYVGMLANECASKIIPIRGLKHKVRGPELANLTHIFGKCDRGHQFLNFIAFIVFPYW